MRQAKDRGVQLGPWHWHKVVLDEGELDGVLGQAVLQHVHVASLEEPAQEVDRACWREDFFHLRGQEHGGHAHRLQLGPRDRAPLHGKEPVDDRDGAEQSLL